MSHHYIVNHGPAWRVGEYNPGIAPWFLGADELPAFLACLRRDAVDYTLEARPSRDSFGSPTTTIVATPRPGLAAGPPYAETPPPDHCRSCGAEYCSGAGTTASRCEISPCNPRNIL